MTAVPFAGATGHPQVGTVLGERFRLEQSLGAGGMAEVFRALDLIDGRRVAVKVLRQQLATSPEAVQRFRREGQVLTGLKNPAVVGVESVQELPGGLVFLVMELLEGETLGARMKRGAMGVRDLAPIVAGCAAGLSAAHQSGVVHRDLKPDNVFLAKLPSGDVQVKILDFGVSKVRGGEKLTQTGQVLGTPRYMSPEQLGAEPDVDPRVDVYALGVILYEALSGGKSPFLVSTPTDLIVSILNGKSVPVGVGTGPGAGLTIETVQLVDLEQCPRARHDASQAQRVACRLDHRGQARGRGGRSPECRRGGFRRGLGGRRRHAGGKENPSKPVQETKTRKAFAHLGEIPPPSVANRWQIALAASPDCLFTLLQSAIASCPRFHPPFPSWK